MSADLAAGPDTATPRWHWDIFCRVIDNHGDLGVCWRLARDLGERGHQVRLWVDDASALHWMAPAGHARVRVLPWRDPLPDEWPGEVVIEAFGCDPPPAFVARMAAAARPPAWVNLEYLSAEPYVERSHGLASPQFSGPGAGLSKWFYYPGYTARTGGLLREPGLAARRAAHDARAHLAAVCAAQGWRPPPPAQARVLLFGYEPPKLSHWLQQAQEDGGWWLITPGRSAAAVGRALQWPSTPAPGSQCQAGALTLCFLPYVDQDGFDRLLWSCDLNLVRGEDSAVRALWAGQPMLWQLYPQADGAHGAKLQAFLDLYLQGCEPGLAEWLRQQMLAWNGLDDQATPAIARWGACAQAWQDWSRARARLWEAQCDLVTGLVEFVRLHRPSPSPG